MSSLKLAEKLANKAKPGSQMSSPMFPVARKCPLQPSRSSFKANNENANANFSCSKSKPVFKIPNQKHDYVPPFSRVFSDKNLYHYFEKFALENQLIEILNFINSCKKYQEKYPSNTQKQIEKHKEIMQKLGLLPSEYVNSVVGAHEDMQKVSPNSFDKCLNMIMTKLENEKYADFIESPHFAKWTLKYYNTEIE